MKKSELVGTVADSLGLSKAFARRAVQSVLDTIATELANGNPVDISGFGSFRIQERAARHGRNPRTGEHIDIPVRKVPIFKARKALKDVVND